MCGARYEAELSKPATSVHLAESRHRSSLILQEPTLLRANGGSYGLHAQWQRTPRRTRSTFLVAAAVAAVSALLLIAFCNVARGATTVGGTQRRRLAGYGSGQSPLPISKARSSSELCDILDDNGEETRQQPPNAGDVGGATNVFPGQEISAETAELVLQQQQHDRQQLIVSTQAPLNSASLLTEKEQLQVVRLVLHPMSAAPLATLTIPYRGAVALVPTLRTPVSTSRYQKDGDETNVFQKRPPPEASPLNGKPYLETDSAAAPAGPSVRSALASKNGGTHASVVTLRSPADPVLVQQNYCTSTVATTSAHQADVGTVGNALDKAWALSPEAFNIVREWLAQECGMTVVEAAAHPFYIIPPPLNNSRLCHIFSGDWDLFTQTSKAALVPSRAIAMLIESMHRVSLNPVDESKLAMAGRQVLSSMTGYVITLNQRRLSQLKKHGVWPLALLFLASDALYVLADSYDLWPVLIPWWEKFFDMSITVIRSFALETRWADLMLPARWCRHKLALVQQLMLYQKRTRPDPVALVGLKRALMCEFNGPMVFKQSVWDVYRHMDQSWGDDARTPQDLTPTILINDATSSSTGTHREDSRTCEGSSSTTCDSCTHGHNDDAISSKRWCAERPVVGEAFTGLGGELNLPLEEDTLEANFSECEFRQLLGAADGVVLDNYAEWEGGETEAEAVLDAAEVTADSLFEALLGVERDVGESLDMNQYTSPQ